MWMTARDREKQLYISHRRSTFSSIGPARVRTSSPKLNIHTKHRDQMKRLKIGEKSDKHETTEVFVRTRLSSEISDRIKQRNPVMARRCHLSLCLLPDEQFYRVSRTLSHPNMCQKPPTCC